jgi:hypothetical protein
MLEGTAGCFAGALVIPERRPRGRERGMRERKRGIGFDGTLEQRACTERVEPAQVLQNPSA